MDDKKDMYICLCNGVRQSQIENAIANGVITMEALQDTLEVNINCGMCERDVVGLLNKGNAEEADIAPLV